MQVRRRSLNRKSASAWLLVLRAGFGALAFLLIKVGALSRAWSACGRSLRRSSVVGVDVGRHEAIDCMWCFHYLALFLVIEPSIWQLHALWLMG